MNFPGTLVANADPVTRNFGPSIALTFWVLSSFKMAGSSLKKISSVMQTPPSSYLRTSLEARTVRKVERMYTYFSLHAIHDEFAGQSAAPQQPGPVFPAFPEHNNRVCGVMNFDVLKLPWYHRPVYLSKSTLIGVGGSLAPHPAKRAMATQTIFLDICVEHTFST